MDYTVSEPQNTRGLEEEELLQQELHKTRLVINLTLESKAMSSSQCDSIFLSVDSLLKDAQQMQRQCRERSEQLSQKAIQLRHESSVLREQSEDAQLHMVWIRQQLEELIDTKAAFEARERQAQKLSKYL